MTGTTIVSKLLIAIKYQINYWDGNFYALSQYLLNIFVFCVIVETIKSIVFSKNWGILKFISMDSTGNISPLIPNTNTNPLIYSFNIWILFTTYSGMKCTPWLFTWYGEVASKVYHPSILESYSIVLFTHSNDWYDVILGSSKHKAYMVWAKPFLQSQNFTVCACPINRNVLSMQFLCFVFSF